MTKQEVLDYLDEVWDSPNYDNLLNAVEVATKYIRGE